MGVGAADRSGRQSAATAGAMLAHYLQRSSAWPELNARVAEFARARPPGVYKAEYLRSLFEYYLERRFSTTKDPKVPSWKSDDLSDAPPLADEKVPEGDLFDPRANAAYRRTLAHSRAPVVDGPADLRQQQRGRPSCERVRQGGLTSIVTYKGPFSAV